MQVTYVNNVKHRSSGPISGRNIYWGYVGGAGSSFAVQVEDGCCTGLNLSLDVSPSSIDKTGYQVHSLQITLSNQVSQVSTRMVRWFLLRRRSRVLYVFTCSSYQWFGVDCKHGDAQNYGMPAIFVLRISVGTGPLCQSHTDCCVVGWLENGGPTKRATQYSAVKPHTAQHADDMPSRPWLSTLSAPFNRVRTDSIHLQW